MPEAVYLNETGLGHVGDILKHSKGQMTRGKINGFSVSARLLVATHPDIQSLHYVTLQQFISDSWFRSGFRR